MITLDLHIGLHKTGSSYLQSMCVKNEAVLKQASVIYPNTGRIGDAHYLISQTTESGIGLKEQLESLYTECSGFDHVLVSSEDLSHCFLDRQKLDHFCRLARELFHIRVIVYLRRQDELKESVYAQVVKDWYRGTIHDENHYEYDHLKRLSILRSQVEKGDLLVRRYRKREARDGIADDFFSIYGLTASPRLEPVEPENTSLDRPTTALLSKVDKEALVDQYAFARYVASSGVCKDDGRRYFMSFEDRTEFLARYADSNRTVAEQFFPELHGELFDSPAEDPSWFPAAGPSEDDYLSLVTKLWNDYLRIKRALGELGEAGAGRDRLSQCNEQNSDVGLG